MPNYNMYAQQVPECWNISKLDNRAHVCFAFYYLFMHDVNI